MGGNGPTSKHPDPIPVDGSDPYVVESVNDHIDTKIDCVMVYPKDAGSSLTRSGGNVYKIDGRIYSPATKTKKKDPKGIKTPVLSQNDAW